jgi:hypothetical protein
MVENHHAVLADDFQPIRPGGLTGTSDKMTDHTIRMFKIGCNLVLHFDFVVLPYTAETTNGLWKADEPTVKVKVVRALVQ